MTKIAEQNGAVSPAPAIGKAAHDSHMKWLEQNVSMAMSLRQLEIADIPDYQRDVIPSNVARLAQAMINRELIPPLIVLYKPEKNNGLSYEDAMDLGDSRLDDLVFTIIDGKNRRAAALEVGMPIGAYVIPHRLSREQEVQMFIRLQWGQHVNSNHLIAIDDKKPENIEVVRLATEENSPLYGKIYLGRGKKSMDKINAVAFTQLVVRKILTPEQIRPFAEFYAKVFYGEKVYAGSFKACAYFWKYLQTTKFDLGNSQHRQALKAFDWKDPDNAMAAKLNSNMAAEAFAQRLIKVWTDYERKNGQ